MARSVAWAGLLALCACGGSEDDGTQEAHATASFDAGLVLLDEQLEDAGALSAGQIQAFLEHTPHGNRSALADYSRGGRSAAEMIAGAAATHDINPLVLLARLQLESSLIGKSTATAWRLDWAMGCGCPDGGGCIDAYEGFDKQIACAAERLRTYLDQIDASGATIAGWAPGRSQRTLDGHWVTPRTRATAANYTYTPWVDAAKKYRGLWMQYGNHVGYQTPAPGGCPSVRYGDVRIQLRPDPTLGAEYGEPGACFVDAALLLDPETLALHPPNVALSPHFRLSEFAAVASSPRMLLDPLLVDTLEAARAAHASPVAVKVGYRSPSAHAAACASQCSDAGCADPSCELSGFSSGRAVRVRSSASNDGLLQAAADAGATSCWREGADVYIGVDASGLGCPLQ